MDYSKIYYQIITRAKNRQLNNYTERHHIVPKCMGGTNNKNNLVDLTAREHFICHLLLVEMYPTNKKLIHAAFMMSVCKGNDRYERDYSISSRMYEQLRLKKSQAMKGSIPWNKGKVGLMPTPWNKGKCDEYGWVLSEESKKNISNAKKGITFTEDHKKSLSESHKGHTRSDESRFRQSQTIKKSIPNICPHCGYSQRGNGIYKYHFDRCKQKVV